MKIFISLVLFFGVGSAFASEPEYIELLQGPRLEIALAGGLIMIE